ncbi:MAG: DUF29 domain-containing protein [Spirochaetia bacterium]|nr:DUF29 domain-containing protein [Spirochaetia bacterium]
MQMVIDLKKLYEKDEHLWLLENAKLLREGKWEQADFDNIAETLEDMGRRDLREVVSRLKVLMIHLLKWTLQTEARSSSWKGTIRHQRDELNSMFEDSYNLKKHAEDSFSKSYKKAREIASDETGIPLSHFPEDPPFTFEQAIGEDYLPQ